MELNRLKRLSLLLSVVFVSFSDPPHKHKVYLIGDSTMANKETKAYPETGWGMPFTYFFDSTVTVDNRAKNGRSTKSFMAEGLWQPVVDQLKEGDYVFIQFGHNDEGRGKAGRYTTPEEFKANLLKYVSDARSKKAYPVLITPVSRRTFNDNGTITESHPIYTDAVREVAKQNNIPLIDLDEKSKALLQQFGAENSKWLYNYLEANEHPNYPEGRQDNTHFSELGARKIAELVLAGIKELNLNLVNSIVKPQTKTAK